MKEVIIACESSNIASRNVILNCGGVYLETYLFKNIELEKYRIDLALNCPFCNIIKKQADAYVIYESENVIAFLDIDPINEGHVLIVPELHESSIDNMPIHILSEIMEVLQKVVTALKDVYHIEGYSIMQNGGEFCDFGHGHFHIFPRYKNDGFGWKYPEGSFECSQKVADQLKDAMSKTNANI